MELGVGQHLSSQPSLSSSSPRRSLSSSSAAEARLGRRSLSLSSLQLRLAGPRAQHSTGQFTTSDHKRVEQVECVSANNLPLRLGEVRASPDRTALSSLAAETLRPGDARRRSSAAAEARLGRRSLSRSSLPLAGPRPQRSTRQSTSARSMKTE